MKKAIFAVCALALTATPAFAQPDDDFLALTGAIDYNCDVTLLGQTTSSINVKISSDQPLGGIRYVCNDAQGFDLKVTSTNGGILRNGTFSKDYVLDQTGGDVPAINFNDAELAAPQSQSAVGFAVGAADDQGSTHNLVLNVKNNDSTPIPGGIALTDTIKFEVSGR